MQDHNDVFDMIADVMIARRATWRDKAACKGMSTETFFPPSNIPSEFARAKAICETCAVINDCRSEWESMPAPMKHHGVWFGTSDSDRRGRRKRS